MDMMVWTARPDLSCDYVSHEWLAFTGCTPEQVLGEGWSREIHPEDLPRWLETCVRAFDAHAPFEIDYRLRCRNGDYRWVRDRAVPRFDADGEFLGYLGACTELEGTRFAKEPASVNHRRSR